MTYKPLRKDLTETTRKCDFCPNYLTSLKAYVLEEIGTGKIAYAGPTCAKNNITLGHTLAGIPDLTKYTLPHGEGESRVAGGAGGSGGSLIDDPNRRALEYLALREEKLSGELKCSYSALKDYYIKSKTETLTDAEVRHINNIEAKAPDQFRLASLQKFYNYLFWIDVGIEKLPKEKTEFLSSVRSTLINKGNISESQKNAVNNWLKKIPGVPQLK
jgi:hypothetical protein